MTGAAGFEHWNQLPAGVLGVKSTWRPRRAPLGNLDAMPVPTMRKP
jgi:hypothetical protein